MFVTIRIICFTDAVVREDGVSPPGFPSFPGKRFLDWKDA